MKYLVLGMMWIAAALIGCQQGGDTAGENGAHSHDEAVIVTGRVVETMDSGGYTYARVSTEGREIWAAGPVSPVAVGDEVTVAVDMPMQGFRSETLGRTFDVVYFTTSFTDPKPAPQSAPMASQKPPAEAAPPAGHPGGEVAQADDLDYSGITRPDGGHTVQELWQQRADLGGQEVRVRGRVVKFLTGIMGKNWIHLRDGTGSQGTDDVTITTQATVAVGDVVVVRGPVTLDKDFGAGYQYALIIEDATVTVEP